MICLSSLCVSQGGEGGEGAGSGSPANVGEGDGEEKAAGREDYDVGSKRPRLPQVHHFASDLVIRTVQRCLKAQKLTIATRFVLCAFLSPSLSSLPCHAHTLFLARASALQILGAACGAD